MSENPAISSTFAGRYQIRKLIGRGGMGTVYLAHDSLLDIEVAVKTVDVSFDRPDALVRFQHEAITTGKLAHPNVARTLDFGLIASSPYMVMEYVEGDSLAAIIRREGKLDVRRAIPIFLDICAGLRHAHDQGILHRDLKPSNIIITSGVDNNQSQAKVVDFGIAKMQGSDFRITDCNSFVGSPLYVSPEQAKNLETDERSDVYSFGCLMFETLTGKPPIVADQIIDTVHQKCTVDAPSLMGFDGLAFPPGLAVVVDKCLRRQREERFPTIDAVAVAIESAAAELERLPTVPVVEVKPADSRRKLFSFLIAGAACCAGLFGFVQLYTSLSSQSASKIDSYFLWPADQKAEHVFEASERKAIDAEADLEAPNVSEASKEFEKANANAKAKANEKANENENEKALRDQEYREIDKLSFFSKADHAIHMDPKDLNRANIAKWSNDKDLSALIGRTHIRYLYLLGCVFIEGSGLKYAEGLPLINLCCVNTPLADDSLRSIGRIKSLRLLMLVDAPISDRGLSYLSKLHNLKFFELTSANVTDKGVAYLSALKLLTNCRLNKCVKLTDACIPALTRLTNLYDLNLSYTSVTDKGLLEILSKSSKIVCITMNGLPLSAPVFDLILNRPLKNLGVLDNAKISNLHLASLAEKTPQLEALSCDCTNVDWHGIASLTKLKQLKFAHLQNLNCDKAVVQQLQALTNLESITLEHCEILNEQLPGFSRLKKLSHFKVLKSEASRVNREGLEKLRARIRELNGRDLNIEFYGKPFE